MIVNFLFIIVELIFVCFFVFIVFGGDFLIRGVFVTNMRGDVLVDVVFGEIEDRVGDLLSNVAVLPPVLTVFGVADRYKILRCVGEFVNVFLIIDYGDREEIYRPLLEEIRREFEDAYRGFREFVERGAGEFWSFSENVRRRVEGFERVVGAITFGVYAQRDVLRRGEELRITYVFEVASHLLDECNILLEEILNSFPTSMMDLLESSAGRVVGDAIVVNTPIRVEVFSISCRFRAVASGEVIINPIARLRVCDRKRRIPSRVPIRIRIED